MKSLVHLTTIILVVALTVSEAAQKKTRNSQADSNEPLSSAETHAREPATVRPVFNKSGKGVVKKFVKVNRLSSSSSSKLTSIENAASTSVQYHSQSLISTANQRPTQLPLTTSAVFVSRMTAGPAAWSSSAPIRAVPAAQTATATTVTRAASTTPLTTTTVAPTASPFRRVLRTSGTGVAHIKPLSSGGAVRQHHDSQPQASLTKKAYTANQFADDDEDDYFSRRRARFLFKSRVGK